MKLMPPLFPALAGILLAFVACSMVLVAEHEYAHQQIFQSFDINSNIKWSPLFVSTIPEPHPTLPDTDLRVMSVLHATNEIYGYQIATILSIATLYSVVLTILITWRLKRV